MGDLLILDFHNGGSGGNGDLGFGSCVITGNRGSEGDYIFYNLS